MLRYFVFLLALVTPTIVSAQACGELRFQPGAYYGDFSFDTPGVGETCFFVGVRPGQTIVIELLTLGNTRIGVRGQGSGYERVEFGATQSRHEFFLYQQTRNQVTDPTVFRVTIR